MAFLSIMNLSYHIAIYMHTHQIPDSEKTGVEAQANVRLDAFMKQLVRKLPKMKLMVEESEKK
ncbi:MAG: hypothetical protein KAI76_06950 [Alphaproteobacteria bacterium]|nr:hypothetical protein [Alphaproteobacteria bacterium]